MQKAEIKLVIKTASLCVVIGSQNCANNLIATLLQLFLPVLISNVVKLLCQYYPLTEMFVQSLSLVLETW